VLVAFAAILVVLVAPAGVRAQSEPTERGQAVSASASALADVESNRGAVIRDIAERWRAQYRPFDPVQNVGGDEVRFIDALGKASAEKLLAASQAQTYEDALAAVVGRWQGPSAIPLEPGVPIANALGSAAADLVYTPVTPCRIIDTRSATGGFAGRIIAGALNGKQFSVSLTNYAAQGGNAGTCNIPIAPAAVAINVTSTDQSGNGNLKVIQTGGGTPNTSFLNFVAGVSTANAGVVRSAGIVGGDNIFIFSAVADTHVVVDIMGYFAAPVATALSCVTSTDTLATVAAGAIFAVDATACPAGYTAVSVNCRTSAYNSVNYVGMGIDTGGWQCQGTNTSGSSITLHASLQCCRVPGS
jgi:hypothetical protein